MHIKIYYTFGKIFDRHLTKYIYVCAYIYIYIYICRYIYIWLIVASINIQQSLVRYQTKL